MGSPGTFGTFGKGCSLGNSPVLRGFTGNTYTLESTQNTGSTLWLVGKDVAEALGYANPRKALTDHVDAEDKGVTKCYTLGGEQDMTIINESGLYSLVLAVRPSPARRGASAPRRAVLPRTRGMQSYALPARPTPL